MPRHVNIHNRNRPTVAEAEALVHEVEAMLFLSHAAGKALAKLRRAVAESKTRPHRRVAPERIRALQEGLEEWRRLSAPLPAPLPFPLTAALPVPQGQATGEDPGLCEVCKEPATVQDAQCVPLCESCFKSRAEGAGI